MVTTTPRVGRGELPPARLPSTAEAAALAEAFAVSLAWTRQQLSWWFPEDPPDSLCRRLRRQVQRGLLTRLRLTAARGSGPYVYFLTRLGSQLLLGPAVTPPRGQPGRDLYHSLGVSAFYLTLQADLQRVGGELIQWWGQAAVAAPIEPGSRSYVNPDGAFLIGHQIEQLALLEYDRAPNAASATQFLNKIVRYLRYFERRVYREHLGQGELRPLLLCLITDQARRERLQARCSPLLERVQVNCPTILFGGLIAATNPLGPVWHSLATGQAVSLLDPALC